MSEEIEKLGTECSAVTVGTGSLSFQPSAELIERVARRMCESRGLNPDETVRVRVDDGTLALRFREEPQFHQFRRQAEDALIAAGELRLSETGLHR